MERIKVLFIAGWGRSGSTVLGNILGQLDGYASLGEMRHIWDRGVLENRKCGCNTFFHECDLWKGIFTKAYGGFDAELAKKMLAARDSIIRTRHLPFLGWSGVRNRIVRRAAEPIENLRKLYIAAREQTGCKVIVDSSKSPADAYLLGLIPEIDLYTVHVVRDPRAVAYSWWSRSKKTNDTKGDAVMDRYNPIRSSVLWNLWNVLLPKIWKREGKHYMLLNYEAFVKSPRASIDSIAQFCGEARENLPFVGETEVSMQACHTVAGNPNRFVVGNLKIKTDNEWETNMSSLLRMTVSAATTPWRWRFGY